MSEIAEILKAVHEVFGGGGQMEVVADARNLGMAYAVPKGLEDSVVEGYGPWRVAELKQVFYRESLLGAVMAEVQMVLTWRCSAAGQYIVDTFLYNNVAALDPTANLRIRVRFGTPSMYDEALEAYEIPFHVDVTFDPFVGGLQSEVFSGFIRADGSGVFNRP